MDAADAALNITRLRNYTFKIILSLHPIYLS